MTIDMIMKNEEGSEGDKNVPIKCFFFDLTPTLLKPKILKAIGFGDVLEKWEYNQTTNSNGFSLYELAEFLQV